MPVRPALAALLFAVAAPAVGQAPTPESPPAPTCFDVALVATVIRQTPPPFPRDDPNRFIMYRPWLVDIEVEQVLIGDEPRERLRVTARLHTRSNPAIRHFLFLMRRGEDGRYTVIADEPRIVEDAEGRFILPIVGPLADKDFYPTGSIPRSYQAALRPVRYRARDAWWLSPGTVRSGALGRLDPAWARLSGGAAFARRGLRVEDWAREIRAEPGALCPNAGASALDR